LNTANNTAHPTCNYIGLLPRPTWVMVMGFIEGMFDIGHRRLVEYWLRLGILEQPGCAFLRLDGAEVEMYIHEGWFDGIAAWRGMRLF
jgi:hypothetical protein